MVFLPKPAGPLPYVAVTLALIWIVVLFLLTNEFLWGIPKTSLVAVITFAVLFWGFHAGFTLSRRYKSQLRDGLLITPCYVIDTDQDIIRYVPLDQLIAVNTSHRYHERNYKGTDIDLSFEERTKTIRLDDLAAAEDAADKISYFKKLFIEATAREDKAYLTAEDDFKGLSDEISPSTSRYDGLRWVVNAAAATLITLGLTFAAISLNNYFDDKKSWALAITGNRASSYRQYVQSHPNGRWLTDATARLEDLYAAAEAKYLSSLRKGYDDRAVEAISALLRYAKDTH
ncbi:MAG TPA: hypothetical protein VGQ55_13585, partial [Pyrinomonadaceae bacterium]|nr:hypothetical protein [Pyrinomonadaceae bacterium]